MAAPPKPWERVGVNNQHAVGSFSNQMSSGPLPDVTSSAGRPLGVPTTSTAAPPVPTRSTQQRSTLGTGYGQGAYGGYSNYSSPYSSYSPMGGMGGMYGGGMYGGYGGYGSGMYSGYGGGAYGMNRYGQQADNGPTGFVRTAEESSRQAFQSIESVVQAFGSVTMMLESTFSAVYNSFRAVIGVADNFTRLKTHFAQIFSALAVIRTLKWLYRKLLVLLRLREAGLDEDVWNSAAASAVGAAAEALPGGGKAKSNWPVWLFFVVVIGGPYLIWRLLSSLSGEQDGDKWADGSADHFLAEAQFDFEGEQDDELSVKRGQRIFIAPKELQPRMRGWLLASVNGQKVGIVPADYIKVLGRRKGKNKIGKGNTEQGQPLPLEPPGDDLNRALPSSQSLPQMDMAYKSASTDSVNDSLEKAYSSSGVSSSVLPKPWVQKEASEVFRDDMTDEEWPK